MQRLALIWAGYSVAIWEWATNRGNKWASPGAYLKYSSSTCEYCQSIPCWRVNRTAVQSGRGSARRDCPGGKQLSPGKSGGGHCFTGRAHGSPRDSQLAPL